MQSTNTVSDKKINRITILNIIGTLAYQGISFLLTPILTRALGSYDYGIITIYNTWVNFIYPIIGLSTAIVIPRIKMSIPEEEQPSYISSLAGLSTISFVLFGCLALLFSSFISKAIGLEPIVLVMLVIHGFGLTLVKFIVSFYIQYQKTLKQFAFTIVVSFATCLSTLFLLQFIARPEQKYLCQIIGFSIPYFLAGLLALLILLRKGKKIVRIDVWKMALPICLPIIFHSTSQIVLGQSDKIMIQMMLENGVSLAGLYGFAHTITSGGSILWTALNNAWSPYYYDLLKGHQFDVIEKRSNRYMFLFTSLYCGFYLIIPEFVKIMGGSGFWSSIDVIPILYLNVYFIFLYSFAVNYKIVTGNTVSIAVSTVAATLCNILLNLIMIPALGMIGAALASLISYGLLFLFHHLSLTKYSGSYNYTFKYYFGGLTPVLCCTAIFYLCKDMWFIRWSIAALIGILLLLKIVKQKSLF